MGKKDDEMDLLVQRCRKAAWRYAATHPAMQSEREDLANNVLLYLLTHEEARAKICEEENRLTTAYLYKVVRSQAGKMMRKQRQLEQADGLEDTIVDPLNHPNDAAGQVDEWDELIELASFLMTPLEFNVFELLIREESLSCVGMAERLGTTVPMIKKTSHSVRRIIRGLRKWQQQPSDTPDSPVPRLAEMLLDLAFENEQLLGPLMRWAFARLRKNL